jgi:hypothetical protein
MNNSGVWPPMTFPKNVVNRGKGLIFRQVIEKAKKIIEIIPFRNPSKISR